MKKEKVLLWFQKMFTYFMFYAMIGWIYEMIIERVRRWPLVNRGSMYGPWLPIYGTGALFFILMIYPIIKNKEKKKRLLYIPLVFIGCMAVATTLELLASYYCEWKTGGWLWQTYGTTYKYHFQSRIALDTSLRFGLGGTVFLYCLQPLFEKFTSKWEGKKLNIFTIVLACLVAVDLICCATIKKKVKAADPLIGVKATREISHSNNTDVKGNPFEMVLYDNGDVKRYDLVTGEEKDFKKLSNKEMNDLYDLIEKIDASSNDKDENEDRPIIIFNEKKEEIFLRRNYQDNETNEEKKAFKFLESKGVL